MKIPFYYDYACPFAYLGSCRVESHLGDLGVEIDFRPVLLSIIKEAAEPALPEGVKPPGLGPRKRENAKRDMQHWAKLCGAEFSPAAMTHRPVSRLLMQAALVAKDEGRFREFHYPAYRARWADGRDIADAAVVREVLATAGLDADAALERAQAKELEERIDADSHAAIERGVFGVPTVFVGDEMFWGNDRFELVRYYIQKNAS